MFGPITIDIHKLWMSVKTDARALRTAQRWLRINRINPGDVPVQSTLVIEDSAFGPVIRYDAFQTTADGHRYLDPKDVSRAATERRTALLWQEPPLEWLAIAGGDR